MIYELRTYNVKPGSVEAVENTLAEVLPIREKYSKLAGYWHTDVGLLNQVVHLWPYDSLAQIPEVSGAAAKDPSGKWPLRGGDNIVEMDAEVLQPALFMKPLELPKRFGDFYNCASTPISRGPCSRCWPSGLNRCPTAKSIPHWSARGQARSGR